MIYLFFLLAIGLLVEDVSKVYKRFLYVTTLGTNYAK